MRIFPVVLLLVHSLVVSRLASGAAVDRHEGDRQRHTSVFNLLDTTRDRRAEEEERTGATTVQHGQDGKEEEDDDGYYYDDEFDDEMSGDYDMDVPRVAMSSKPKDPSSLPEPQNTEETQRRGNGRKKGKGKGRKRNPCLKKYKDLCIHGTCQYLREIRAPSCVCHPNYSGERCQLFTLPVHTAEGYSRTTALAVIAVVLSSVCLTIIGLLLMLRFHKRGAYDVESEEKVKLGLASNN
ncbi:PREDICTED: proheparin-binding EGF-like growth factor [Poecilia mexicana]|uniref:Proheparin-binding EGF-like growth factor n=1 Tax=Poecilia mexicana TaxID=48701 RepID=A0A3B3XPH0_9TELE|nr:PREDICTED: proheparin-binding EGF-like growth factor [Poecilia formosa]XP_014827059.1 PREDICTED: proheparin-binding EGF-like growth factor [Poecilia mexicana]